MTQLFRKTIKTILALTILASALVTLPASAKTTLSTDGFVAKYKVGKRGYKAHIDDSDGATDGLAYALAFASLRRFTANALVFLFVDPQEGKTYDLIPLAEEQGSRFSADTAFVDFAELTRTSSKEVQKILDKSKDVGGFLKITQVTNNGIIRGRFEVSAITSMTKETVDGISKPASRKVLIKSGEFVMRPRDLRDDDSSALVKLETLENNAVKLLENKALNHVQLIQ